MGYVTKMLGLLLWKNFTLQMRNKVQTIVEIIIPLLFTIIFISIRAAISPKPHNQPTKYPPFDPFDIKEIIATAIPSSKYILYAPNHGDPKDVMEKKLKPFLASMGIAYDIDGFRNEEELEKAYHDGNYKNNRYETMVSKDDPSNQTNPVLAAVIFDEPDFTKSNIKYRLRFPAVLHEKPVKERNKDGLPLKVRWVTEFLYELFPLPRDRENFDDTKKYSSTNESIAIMLHKMRGGLPGYWREGFLFLQKHIEKEIIKIKAKTANVPVEHVDKYTVLLNRYPYPKYDDDGFIVALQVQFAIFMMLSYMYPIINITKSIAYEKEKRLKEAMKIMGLQNWLHWTAWFIKSLVFLMISTILLILFYKLPFFDGYGILKYADGTLLFVFFMVYVFATITLGFLISTFFSTANTASTAAGVIFFLTYFPYFFLVPRYDKLSKGEKLVNSIFSNTAMAFGCQLIAKFEGTGAGVQWSTVAKGVTPDDTLTLLDMMLMMLLDGFIYLLLALYIESVYPGEYGIPLPWNYPFTKWYWCDLPRPDKGSDENGVEPKESEYGPRKSDVFEKEPKGHAGIKIRGLTKKFGKKVAVNGLYLNFYENQVTALLGHNGAGKTTTMSMLTGLFPPTSGTAIVNGFDIRKEIKSVRGSLGLCPQHDVLYDDLTVEEHLWFFCLLKGVEKKFVRAEIDRMLGVIMLEKKRHAPSRTLSGGMKRKLSVGIALIGGSRVVLLDEPTSGMDPTARRSTWDLITNEKKGRTIVLSTHFMDEADLLGDRVAIMAEGQAQCCGSSLFLKKRYGGGYHLIIVKGPGCKIDMITQLLQKRIPELVIDQNIGAELSYSLPEEKSSIYPEMFHELETRKDELGIESYGCSITQMEEVFMRVGEQLEKKQHESEKAETGKDHNKTPSKNAITAPVVAENTLDDKATANQLSNKSSTANDAGNINDSDALEKPNLADGSDGQAETGKKDDGFNRKDEVKNEGFPLLVQQFRAMMVKKYLFTSRNKIFFISQIFVPVLFVLIAIILYRTLPDIAIPKEREINLKDYPESITSVQCESKEMCDQFKQVVSSTKSKIVDSKSKSLTDFILSKSKEDLPTVSYKYIVGLHAKDTVLTGFFNNQPYHTSPLALNLISNTILRNVTNKQDHSITVSNHPLKYKEGDKADNLVETDNEGAFIGFTTSFGVSFLAASFVAFVIKERETKSKHLQFVSGVRFPIFWSAHFLWDAVNFQVAVIILLFALLVGSEDFKTAEMLLYYFLVMFCYGWAAIPLMYLFSFMFTVPSAGYTKLALFNFLTGLSTYLTIAILHLETFDLENVADSLEWFFMLFPNFDVGYAITLLTKNKQVRGVCPKVYKSFKIYLNRTLTKNPELGSVLGSNPCNIPYFKTHPCCNRYKVDYLAWENPGIGRHLLYLFVIGAICFLTLFLIESKLLEKIMYRNETRKYAKRNSTSQPKASIQEDEDVAEENFRIRNTDLPELFQTENMVLSDLTKFYGNFLAVNGICLGVKPAQCFGLLGVNGAGKTTTFKMLTGDIPITAGNAYVAGRSVKSEIKKVQNLIGYCPQFDALIPELTGRETIRLFARLRGIQENKIDALADELGEVLLFAQHMEKPCGTYSGGNKRKLSTALALIGNPPLVFLDEPTTGMDPVARRHLWNAIIKVRESGTSVVLTSHSMEECEALCTRLAIMVNGKFRCLGSTQHLKNKFGDGYILIAQLGSSEEEQEQKLKRTSIELGTNQASLLQNRQEWEQELSHLRGFIQENFPGCELKEIHPGYVHYHIKEEEGVTWSEIFKKMEEAKSLFKLEAYSVGQSSLEQIFLTFTHEQAEGVVT